ncbi:hypothetical protein MKW98_023337 [Papaver atlanticum]|uniref:Myelin-associated oligodendrocyte basic protein n=1 Tax=Papaver atlanticum TaxID=357466 RepID=A0AAD4SYV2_9MAGN|nr:hypothetical protein MKW98_023337 [Papaver atlanticum]
MATASLLLETTSFVVRGESSKSSLNWNPLLKKTFPTTQIHFQPIRKNRNLFLKRSEINNFKMKCLLKSGEKEEEKERKGSSIDGIIEVISKAFKKVIQKPAIAAIILGLLLTYDPHSALAASGGRVGGRAFSSHSSSSSSSSRSYSPSTSSRGFAYSVPYSSPSLLGFGGGGLYVGPAIGFGAGSGFFLILAGFAAFVLVSGFLSDQSDGSVLTDTQKTTVIKLQVGLLGMARSLQKDLDKIAEVADTSTTSGLSYILQESTLAMLRHPDYCISGYSSVDVKRGLEDGEKHFNQLSIEERGKFDEETLVNVNNIKRQSTTSKRASGFSNEYIVITILVAAEGVHKLPAVNGSANLKEALQKLGSIPTSKIMAVEVLWTPQNENDTLTERELLEDYPLLRPL